MAGAATTLRNLPAIASDVRPTTSDRGANGACRAGESRGGGLLAAALALPGLAATLPVAAEAPPAAPEFALHWAHYQDFQGNQQRIRVNTPSLFVLLPVGEQWAVRATYVADAVSGASPLFHDTLSGASGKGIADIRRAQDLEVTRYFDRGSLALGYARSREDDYDSDALRVRGSIESADRQTTYTVGIGRSDDTIDTSTSNRVALDESRDTTDVQLGVTRVLGPVDLFSASVVLSHGTGYFDDPYKSLDRRPDARDQHALVLRWNHHLRERNATLRTYYRWFGDDWGIQAHAVEAEFEQFFGEGFSVTPGLRYYTQSAADFYFDPPFPSGFKPGHDYSADTRLSAFGAITASVTLSAPLGYGWSGDLRFLYYRQENGWRAFGEGSPGIESLAARSYELGFRRTF